MFVSSVLFIPSVSSVAIAAASTPQPPAADWATVFLLRFDETPLKDAGALNARIEPADAALAEGRFGKALDCARGHGVEVRSPSGAWPREALTLECWLRLEEAGAERLQRVAGITSMFGLYVAGGKTPSLVWFTTVGDEPSWKSVKVEIPLKKWVHAAGTFDGQKLRLYIDGQLAGEAENMGTIVDKTVPIVIGQDVKSGQYLFRGQLDEVRLSKIARTEFMSGQPAARPKPTAALLPLKGDEHPTGPAMDVYRAAAAPKLDGKLDDAAWASAPEFSFVKTRDAATPEAATRFQLAWDDQCLYVAYRCFEKGLETQIEGPAKRGDPAIAKADAVETFLQPGGPGTPYFQIMANPEGGVLAHKWQAKAKPLAWEGAGVRAGGEWGDGVFVVELAIPFAELGAAAPAEGAEWRANFCRNELPSKEWSAWSPTGGGFHETDHFGALRFRTGVAQPAGKGAAAASAKEIRGMAVDERGAPVVGLLVKWALGRTRTDAQGEFTLRGAFGDEVALRFESPLCQPVTGKVALRSPVEILEPVTVKTIDPYRPAAAAKLGDGAVTWLKSSIEEPPDMTRAPKAEDAMAKLELLATAGEFETRAVAFVANRALERPGARVTALTGAAGTIPEAALEARWTQRLLKRTQYKKAREDAAWSWRFLWREAPPSVEAGQLRQLVITAHVPDSAKPGLYRGELNLSAAGAPVAMLPVELRVPAFRLAAPAKRVGAYYRGAGKSDEQIRIELQDIRDHGGSLLIWRSTIQYETGDDGAVRYDTSGIRHDVLLQKELGIGPPYLIGPNPEAAARLAGLTVANTPEFAKEVLASAKFRAIYAGALEAIARTEKELNAGEFVLLWMDEIMNQGKFEPWMAFGDITRQLSKNRIYITIHNRDQAKVDAASRNIDIRCYHGHTLDSWQLSGHTWEELQNELDAARAEAWNYYNIRDITVTSEYARLCNGYWLWRSPLTAHVPWIYYSYGGSPFDDLDSDQHDFAYAAPHPSRPEMVSTLEWECFREGYDDLRYLATLEQAIAKATGAATNAATEGGLSSPPLSERIRAAQTLRDSYWSFVTTVPEQAEKLTADDYTRRRSDMAAAIEALMK